MRNDLNHVHRPNEVKGVYSRWGGRVSRKASYLKVAGL